MKVKIKNLNQLNDILFYSGCGMAKDSLVCIMNENTLNKLTADFTKEFKEKNIFYPSQWNDPTYFAKNNGVYIAIGEWLNDGEVDIKL